MENARKPHRHRWLTALSLSVILSVALYLVVLISADASRVHDAARRLPAIGWGAILGLSTANYLLRFVRWHVYLRRLGHRVPFARHFAIYLSGFAMTTTPGKAGEAIRSLYLHERGVPYPQSLAALFAERLLDLLAMLALAAIGAAAIGVNATWIGIGGAVGLAIVILLRSPGVLAIARRMPMPHERLAHWRNHFAHLLESSASLLEPTLLIAALALGVVSWGAEGLGLHVIAQSLGLPVDLSRAVGIYALAMLGGAASLIPGGLGGAEAVMAALLAASGAGLPEAVAATLICRAATLWFAILLGMIAMAVLQLRKTRGTP